MSCLYWCLIVGRGIHATEYNSDKDFNLGYRINETEIKLKLFKLYKNAHKINYGLSSKLYLVSPGQVNPIGESSIVQPLDIQGEKGWESALFISDNVTVNEKFSIDLGLRYSFYAALGSSSQPIYEDGVPKNEASLIEIKEFDNNEFIKTYGGPEARISARYLLAPDISVKAAYNNTFQYIHTLTNNTTVSPTDTWKLSDTNIKPQRASQVSLGFFKNFDNLYIPFRCVASDVSESKSVILTSCFTIISKPSLSYFSLDWNIITLYPFAWAASSIPEITEEKKWWTIWGTNTLIVYDLPPLRLSAMALGL